MKELGIQKITPFLWFDDNLEEAIGFYTSVFKNFKVGEITRYPEGSPFPSGTVMTAAFQLEGQNFYALNAGPQFKFNEAISMFVTCDNQEEIDYYWERLTADGGQESMCGWLKDKFGLSWQIVPPALLKMIGDNDREKASRAMEAMMKMKKIDLGVVQKAYNGN